MNSRSQLIVVSQDNKVLGIEYMSCVIVASLCLQHDLYYMVTFCSVRIGSIDFFLAHGLRTDQVIDAEYVYLDSLLLLDLLYIAL